MSIRALVVEDEKPAAEHLLKLLGECVYELEVLKVLDSVSQSLAWLQENPLPDILFLDIHLADGLSFEIFNRLEISCPVIFTTAYEEYAIRAFKQNSVDYLLKPIGLADLEFALKKFMEKGWQYKQGSVLSNRVELLAQMLTRRYKTRFAVQSGTRFKSIDTGNIVCFFSLGSATFLQDHTGKSYDISYSLEQLETELDPLRFFRINRRYIVQIDAIRDIQTYSSSRLKLILKNSTDEDILVSRRKVQEFKDWLEK
jgi:two-component system, LytTR family, response regulator